jgi:tetratricopeptide (TPR) repeat protein
MSEARKGQVVTFYSYKGGTGRTMALANVAWILAAAGKRVLVADWDLESPGLHRFFKPFLDIDAIASTGGVIDMIREFEEQVGKAVGRPPGWERELAQVERYAFSLNWDFPGSGALDFLSAGRQNDSYAAALSGLDWEVFYNRLQGSKFLDALRQDMINHYDYTLIDSRTGFSDVSDICTGHLPDTLIDCFTLSDQGISGAAQVAMTVRAHRIRKEPGEPERYIRVLPVAMRVDPGEQGKADAGRALARKSFPGLPAGLTETQRTRYFDEVEVPYITYFAYEETLATFAERPGIAVSLLGSYSRLTQVITAGEVKEFKAMDENLRVRWKRQFERTLDETATTIVLDYAAEDQVWAEWIGNVLINAGVSVVDRGPIGLPQSDEPRPITSRVLAVVSARYVALRESEPREVQWDEPVPLSVYIADIAWPGNPDTGVSVVDHSADGAARQVLSLLGGVPGSRRPSDRSGTIRFPGTDPRWFLAPARNARFTGRVEALNRLRGELRSGGKAVVLPIALQGMGGIGKTQLALEYVHRFKSSYDLVWWINADPPQFIDTELTDLGAAIGIPAERTAVESALAALAALRRGHPTDRWLLIFDNADDLSEVEKFLPQGGPGHLLITSRNAEWGNQAKALPVDVFQRPESVMHLRSRVPSMGREQAEDLAEALADLPIAVAVAGAWLAETGTPVPEYLRVIQRDGVAALRMEAVWGLSLERLDQRSPGAYRLLQICSVLAPEIALELLYSDQLAAYLIEYDLSVSDRLMRGSLIQHINKLALLRLDVHAGQAQVHRLLQDVVRRQMSAAEIAATSHQAHLVLAKFRPNGDVEDPTTWTRFRILWPHLEVSGASGCYDESVRQLFIDRAGYLWRRGDFAQGVAFGNRIAKGWEAKLAEGEHDENWTRRDADSLRRQWLHLRFYIANILREQGRFEAALALDNDILVQQRELLGTHHSHTLMTSGSRAADLRALGRYAETLPMEQETYRAWGEEFGEDHPRTLSAASNLATSYRSMGNFHEAEKIDSAVWRRRQAVLGQFHPYTLHSAGCVGRDLREAGEHEKSVELLRRLLTSSRLELGIEVTVTLKIQVDLAVSLRSAGRAHEAAPLLEEAFDVFSARFDPSNPDALNCRLNRAANLLAMGDIDPALTEMLWVTREYEKSLGVNHPFTLVCLSDQSAIYRSKGDGELARALVTRAADGCRRALGPAHPYSLGAEMNLAICESDDGETVSAQRRVEELVERMKLTLGPNHPDTLACQVNLEIITDSLARKDPRGLGTGRDSDDSSAFGRLAQQLGREHPTIKVLRAGHLTYRVIDPHDPF